MGRKGLHSLKAGNKSSEVDISDSRKLCSIAEKMNVTTGVITEFFNMFGALFGGDS
jgi:hypothetical protein